MSGQVSERERVGADLLEADRPGVEGERSIEVGDPYLDGADVGVRVQPGGR